MKDGCAGIVLGFDTKDGCVVVEGCFGNGCVAVESWLIAAIMTNSGWGVCVWALPQFTVSPWLEAMQGFQMINFSR